MTKTTDDDYRFAVRTRTVRDRTRTAIPGITYTPAQVDALRQGDKLANVHMISALRRQRAVIEELRHIYDEHIGKPTDSLSRLSLWWKARRSKLARIICPDTYGLAKDVTMLLNGRVLRMADDAFADAQEWIIEN